MKTILLLAIAFPVVVLAQNGNSNYVQFYLNRVKYTKMDDMGFNYGYDTVGVKNNNIQRVTEFGINPDNVFPMWDWVGGRFSLWSAVGLSVSLAVGFDNYNELLNGANEMDEHFKTADFDNNIPVVSYQVASCNSKYSLFLTCPISIIPTTLKM